MATSIIRKLLVLFFCFTLGTPVLGADTDLPASVTPRIASLTKNIASNTAAEYRNGSLKALMVGNKIRIEDCNQYPYHESTDRSGMSGYQNFADDLVSGLTQGLQCLSGQSDAGKLHPFHERQADKLMSILEGPIKKTFRCVEDKTYAYAMARLPPDSELASEQFETVARDVLYPAVIIDTYRISGYLTRKHEPIVYRDFFKLNESQIDVHLNIKPQQFEGMHRYADRASLLFHEMIHWLDFTHSNTYPDMVHLYETCCFGGSEFISDENLNSLFQNRACAILKDEELWESNMYQQVRLWKYKEYDQLKSDMRQEYN